MVWKVSSLPLDSINDLNVTVFGKEGVQYCHSTCLSKPQRPEKRELAFKEIINQLGARTTEIYSDNLSKHKGDAKKDFTYALIIALCSFQH